MVGRRQWLPPLTATTSNPPFVTLPPPTSHLMLIVASSPILRQQRAGDNTLTSSLPHQRATAPPPPPFDKILSIEKRRQTTGDGRGRSIGGRGGWRRGNGIHFGGWGESEECLPAP
jgi:hypothetical protein